MKQQNQFEIMGQRLWKRVLILPLCTCLVVAGSAINPVWSAGASEDERVHDRLWGKKVHAVFKDDGFVEGKVKEVQGDALRIAVTKSSNPRMVPTGVRDIPIERISTVRWTEGSKNRKILFTVGLVTGIVGGLWIAGSSRWFGESLNGANMLALIGATAGGGISGYLLGSRLDQKSITLETPRPMAADAPKK